MVNRENPDTTPFAIAPMLWTVYLLFERIADSPTCSALLCSDLACYSVTLALLSDAFTDCSLSLSLFLSTTLSLPLSL